VWSRRTLLASALALAAGGARAAATASSSAVLSQSSLRILRVRHRTVLVELGPPDGGERGGHRRALIDPCFAPDLGAGVAFRARAPAILPEETGPLELLLVTAHEAGAFSGASTARLRGRSASCLVADLRTATILRHQGYRRVRVVVAGDVFATRDVVVRVSPSRGLLGGPAVGFHLERAGRTLWHAGAPPPLDVADGAVVFARAHHAEVMAACAWGLSLAGVPLTVDHGDALILAGLCRARYALLLDDDATLAPMAGLVFAARPGSRRAPAGVHAKVAVVEPGRWVRVAPR
jgi:hypothetical protein